VRVRLLRLWAGMTKSHSVESTIIRKIVWIGVVLLTATTAACGGSTQAITGTAPSQVSSIEAASESGGSFSLLKEGKGRGHSPAPEIGTTPDPDAPQDDADGTGKGYGHGNASIQYEGFIDPTLIEGSCDGGLKIPINDVIVTTVKTEDLTTEFQRVTCEVLKASTAPSIHLHIAAKKMGDDSLVAIYVRMQGPKFDHGDDGDEDEDTAP
jgi:hypothetical protein